MGLASKQIMAKEIKKCLTQGTAETLIFDQKIMFKVIAHPPFNYLPLYARHEPDKPRAKKFSEQVLLDR